jgi:hypothetical protein
MAVRKNIKKTTLRQYMKNTKANENSRLRTTPDGKMFIPAVYCHNGHKLMTDDARFDGLRGIKLLVFNGHDRHIMIISPFLDDQRKEGANLPEMSRMRICCPTCQEELEQLIPCTCRPGSYRRALWLGPKPGDLGAVGICETYGCPQSFVNDSDELLFEVETE